MLSSALQSQKWQLIGTGCITDTVPGRGHPLSALTDFGPTATLTYYAPISHTRHSPP